MLLLVVYSLSTGADTVGAVLADDVGFSNVGALGPNSYLGLMRLLLLLLLILRAALCAVC